MFDRNKFRAKIIENGLTTEQVAEKLNINVVTLYRKMNGVSDFTRNEVQQLKEILNLDVHTAYAIFFAEQLT
ncbi:hypothetical protein DW1_1103 [Proteiniborus sp. DW1]|uniref:helix-turn-helix domain-containing protein n=1 Tax=Proteiniborus sp. DW1 TaxID=1889883 RepID=UPI00092E0AD6|nr:helix-turn-helix transcriptional regulator [Proteiniborus sp. DW1]SCG82676.1 hypothetical protein DW1_1103 [Proteiniborus sp. DW1]